MFANAILCSLRNDYVEAIQGVMKLLMKRTSKSGLLFIGELQSGARDFKPKMVNYFSRRIISNIFTNM